MTNNLGILCDDVSTFRIEKLENLSSNIDHIITNLDNLFQVYAIQIPKSQNMNDLIDFSYPHDGYDMTICSFELLLNFNKMEIFGELYTLVLPFNNKYINNPRSVEKCYVHLSSKNIISFNLIIHVRRRNDTYPMYIHCFKHTFQKYKFHHNEKIFLDRGKISGFYVLTNEIPKRIYFGQNICDLVDNTNHIIGNQYQIVNMHKCYTSLCKIFSKHQIILPIRQIIYDYLEIQIFLLWYSLESGKSWNNQKEQWMNVQEFYMHHIVKHLKNTHHNPIISGF